MRARTYANILTLVLVYTSSFAIGFCVAINLSVAAPHFDAPTKSNHSEESEVVRSGDKEVSENLAITPAPALERNVVRNLILKYNKSDYYYSYKTELEVHGGVIFGILDSSDDKDFINYVLGFNYLLPPQTSLRWSLGADLSTVGQGHLHFAKRKVYNEKGAFRPFYEMGIMHKVVPSEKMATISNVENYLLWGAVGFSDIRRPPKSVQCQIQGALGIKDFLIMVTYGYSWGF